MEGEIKSEVMNLLEPLSFYGETGDFFVEMSSWPDFKRGIA